MVTELIAIFTGSESAELVDGKRCTKCHEIKPLTDYYTDRRNDDGKYSHCKQCAMNYTRSYIEQNQEKWDEYKTNYYQENREKMLEYGRQYAIDNPIDYWARCTLSHHRLEGFDVNLDQDKLVELAKRTTHCPICGQKLDWTLGDKGSLHKNSPTLDRMNNEKTMTHDNTWIICVSCNSSKGRKTLKEWLSWCSMKGRVNNLCS